MLVVFHTLHDFVPLKAAIIESTGNFFNLVTVSTGGLAAQLNITFDCPS